MHGRITHHPTNFSWVIPDMVAGSGKPTSRAELDWLREQGIRCIVTMTEEPLPASWLDVVSYLHVPTPDMAAPAISDIDRAVDFMHQSCISGRPAMVHCAAGLGRAGTILACYLVKHHNMGAFDAITRIRRLRPGSVQSAEQIKAISEYAQN